MYIPVNIDIPICNETLFMAKKRLKNISGIATITL